MIARYDGHIAQHLGDGLMVYFGWPQAHEDDAQRAVHAGLGIVEALGDLNHRLQMEKGIRLTVRIGVHTGLVVVGNLGAGDCQEHLALGETPNVASRIEGLAAPDTIAISAATYQLVQGYFVCEDLGLHRLKGMDEPPPVYRVVAASGKQSRLEVVATHGLTPLVGREQEVGTAAAGWRQRLSVVPATVRAVTVQQWALCSQEEQRLLAVASVAGLRFSAATVAAGLDADLIEVEGWCAGLAQRGVLLETQGEAEWPDGTVATQYGFRHALYQQVLYD